ncbi:MAG: hypothetical protein ABIT58_04405 [Ferruginibacter sp.]
MKKVILMLLSISFTISALAQKRQTIGYDGILENNDKLLKNTVFWLTVSIIKNSVSGPVTYSERQKINTDSAGEYHVEIGDGTLLSGQYDSIIWSDGNYYLRTEFDSLPGNNRNLTRHILLRISPQLSNDYEQGTVLASEFPDYGSWHLMNSRNKRPKLVTIDLSTSYANLAYPANTYPIYRHYEWCDPDGDGKGNAFEITYSENTNNAFIENSNKLGDVRLYAKPFQELTITSTNKEISVSISKPVPYSNHNETYAIKGPWKFIYYVEW